MSASLAFLAFLSGCATGVPRGATAQDDPKPPEVVRDRAVNLITPTPARRGLGGGFENVGVPSR